MKSSFLKRTTAAPARWVARTTGILAACGLLLGQNLRSAPEIARQTIHNTVPAAVATAKKVRHVLSTEKLDLAISLPLRNKDKLTSLLAQIYDPSSPNFHHYLTSEQFTEQFGPTKEDYEAVATFAHDHGLTVTTRNANRAVMGLRGTVLDIEKAMHVSLDEYQHPTENRTFHAPNQEPTLDLAVPVLFVQGLDDFNIPKPHFKFMHMEKHLPNGQTVSDSQFTPPGKAHPDAGSESGDYLGKDLRAAYIPGATLTGSGQSIGVFELGSGFYQADINNYESADGLGNIPVVTVLLDGFGGAPDTSGSNPPDVEVSLDIEMAMGMAPGVASIYCYEGEEPDDVLASMASQNTCSTLSCSWGWNGSPSPDQSFLQMAAQGQSFFCASGDSGAYPAEPNQPDDDPNITMVGGTTLSTAGPVGAWTGETAWVDGGGGISHNVPIPVWQQGISMTANYGSTTFRNVPDVAAIALNVYITALNGETGGVGGTSCATPCWAGIVANANQLAAANAQPLVGFMNPAIYNLGKGLTAHSYPNLMHDITSGNNGSATMYPAVPGYDLVTGWGAPASANLLAYLGLAEPLSVSPFSPVTFSGGAGGPFTPTVMTYTLTNNGTSSLNWSLPTPPSWLDVSATSGTLVSGGPSTTVTVSIDPSATNLVAGSYVYSLAFTNENDNFVQTQPVTLAVVTAPVITSQPANQVVLTGATATFTVGIATNALVYYQWQESGTNIPDTTTVSGVNTPTLAIANCTAANVASYSVVVSNVLGVATSSNASLTISNSAPVIVTAPTNTTVLPGANAAFTVLAVGNTPYVYRWYLYGTNLSNKAKFGASTNSPALLITNCVATNFGAYTVSVSNSLGCVTSTVAMLNLTPVTVPGVGLVQNGAFSGSAANPQNPYSAVTYVNGSYYGTSFNGGNSTTPYGTVYSVTTGGGFTTKTAFTGTDGAGPVGSLCLAKNGDLYGAAYSYGTYDDGTLIQMSGSSLNTEATLTAFNGDNGAEPIAGLVQASDNNLYGCANAGGAYGFGTVFRQAISPSTLTNLTSFNGADGAFPSPVLIQATDGNLYGTSESGGDANGDGTIFKISPGGRFTLLAKFNGTNGSAPIAGLIQASDGNFYGTTLDGGALNNGTIFQMLPNGAINSLYSFTGGVDGSHPWAGLVQGTNGNLYGTCEAGGAYGVGTVFQVSLSGSFAAIGELDGFQGAVPEANLVQGPDGNLYGTCFEGGFNGAGSFFSITNSGPLSISGQPVNLTVDAGAPAFFSVATTGNNATYYQWQENGTNLVNGGQFSGVGAYTLVISNSVATNAALYSVIISNAYNSVTSSPAMLTVITAPPAIVSQPASVTTVVGSMAFFSVTATGDLPLAYQWQQNGVNLTDGGNILGSGTPTLSVSNLTLAVNGNYYSVIVSNSSAGLTSSNAVLTVLPVAPSSATAGNTHLFAGGNLDGANPTAALIQGKDGYLYGTASAGGSGYQGVIFRATLSGNETNLYGFTYSLNAGDAAAGSSPFGGLVQATNGNLFGTCQAGGTNGYGTLFRMTNFATLTALYNFTGGADGGSPDCTLALGSDGYYYGVAYADGTSGNGTVFRMTATNGVLKVIYDFTGGADGSHPQAGLMQASDGYFYGTATEGGANGGGTAFRIGTDGTLTVLATFNGFNGATPVGGLVQATDGNLYGTCGEGGAYGFGTVYRLSTNGALTTIYSFAGTNGLFPYASLIQGKDGNLYGTVSGGGPGGAGGVFLLTTNGALTPLLWFDGFNGGDPESALLQASDGNLYGTASQGGIGYNPTSGGGWGTLFRVVLPVFFTTNGLSASNAIAALPYSGSLAGEAVTPAGDSISYSLVSGPAWLNVATNGLLSGTPPNASIGTNLFVISVTDTNGFSASANLQIIVFADPPPTFFTTNITEPSIAVDTAFAGTLATNATAPYLTNGDVLTFAKVSGPAWLGVAPDGTLSGTPMAPDAGSNTFVVSVTDLGGASNTASLLIFVYGTPSFSSAELYYGAGTAGIPYGGTLATNATDSAAGDTLTFYKVTGSAWLAVAPNGALSGTPGSGDVGDNSFLMLVVDSGGFSSVATVQITVNPDLPPVITANPLIGSPATVGVPYAITVAANAVETNTGDALAFAKVSGPAWFSVAASGAITGTPAVPNIGTIPLVVSVTDLAGVATNFTVSVTVSEPPPKFTSPVLTNAPAIAGLPYGGTLATNVIDAALANGDTLAFFIVTGPAWLDLSTNGVLSGTPNDTVLGTNVFEVEALDSDGLSAAASLEIVVNPDVPPTVGVNPLIGPPAIDGVPYVFATATNAVETNANDTVTFAEVSGPAWVGVATNGVISGTPNGADGGSNTVVLGVTDLGGVFNTFSVLVYVYTPPVFTPNLFTGPPATAGVPYVTDLVTNVVDTNVVDTLRFAEVSGPAWLTVATNGVASGTPLSANAGTNTFTVSVTDLVGLSTIGTMRVYVTAVPVVATITPAGAAFVLSWTGGVAPYQVLTSTNLLTPWQDMGSPTNATSVTVTNGGAAMFYQIQGH